MFAGIVAATLCGCGRGGPERFHLAGSVTFDGKPVPTGAIRFEPDHSRGNEGPVGHAVIVNGKYTTRSPGSKGVLRGPLVAIIHGGPLPETNGEPGLMWFTDHAATITVDPSSGTTTFDFDVPRRPTPKN